MIDLAGLVAVSGFCLIAGLVNKEYALLPVLLSIVDQLNPVRGAFVGVMVVIILAGVANLRKLR